MADSGTIRHPEPQLTADNIIPTQNYGLLKAISYPDGTQIHINLEQGKENFRIFHSSGTYLEIRNDGSMIHHVANNITSYHKGGMSLTMDNNGDVKLDGHMRVALGEDCHVEAGKNLSMVVNGRFELAATGHVKISGADVSISTLGGSVAIAADRDIEMLASEGRILAQSAAVQQYTSVGGDIFIGAGGDVQVNAQGNINQEAQSAVSVKADGGAITAQAAGAMSLKASGDITTQGATTKLQGGGASSPPITVS